jgi:hypothetical protein
LSYSQDYSWDCAIDYFRYRPAYEQISEKLKKYYNNKIDYGNSKLNKFLQEKTYSFVENGSLFMISYEPKQNLKKINNHLTEKRYVYLYRLDKNLLWYKACSEPIRIDSITYQNNLTIKNVYYPLRDGYGSKECIGYVKHYNNNVEINLTYYFNVSKRGISNKHILGIETIILSKINENEYKITKKIKNDKRNNI